MKIIYRLSDAGYKKVKHPFVNNKNCLTNFIKNFLKGELWDLTILADNVSNETYDMIKEMVPETSIVKSSLGSMHFHLQRKH